MLCSAAASRCVQAPSSTFLDQQAAYHTLDEEASQEPAGGERVMMCVRAGRLYAGPCTPFSIFCLGRDCRWGGWLGASGRWARSGCDNLASLL